MSDYTDSYKMRYQTPSLTQQIEVATVHAANDAINEDPGAPDHANRIRWADYAITNSSVAYFPFCWPVCENPAILAAYQTDNGGAAILDSDVQFVVNSNLAKVINSWVEQNPAPA